MVMKIPSLNEVMTVVTTATILCGLQHFSTREMLATALDDEAKYKNLKGLFEKNEARIKRIIAIFDASKDNEDLVDKSEEISLSEANIEFSEEYILLYRSIFFSTPDRVIQLDVKKYTVESLTVERYLKYLMNFFNDKEGKVIMEMQNIIAAARIVIEA